MVFDSILENHWDRDGIHCGSGVSQFLTWLGLLVDLYNRCYHLECGSAKARLLQLTVNCWKPVGFDITYHTVVKWTVMNILSV